MILQFFQDGKEKFSMGRLVTFLLILIIFIEAIYFIIFLKQPWPLESNRLTVIMIAVGGKTVSQFLESRKVK